MKQYITKKEEKPKETESEKVTTEGKEEEKKSSKVTKKDFGLTENAKILME